MYCIVTIIYHQGLAIHHPHHRPVNSTPIHLHILSGISYIESMGSNLSSCEMISPIFKSEMDQEIPLLDLKSGKWRGIE